MILAGFDERQEFINAPTHLVVLDGSAGSGSKRPVLQGDNLLMNLVKVLARPVHTPTSASLLHPPIESRHTLLAVWFTEHQKQKAMIDAIDPIEGIVEMVPGL